MGYLLETLYQLPHLTTEEAVCNIKLYNSADVLGVSIGHRNIEKLDLLHGLIAVRAVYARLPALRQICRHARFKVHIEMIYMVKT